MKRNHARSLTVGLAIGAVAGLATVPVGARAADASTPPSASIAFSSDVITSGTQPELTFITAGVPSGSVRYLQEIGAGLPWHSIGRINATTGTVRAPSDSVGQYEYRLLVASPNGTPIVTSAPAALTVSSTGGAIPATSTPTATASASSCTACQVANDALPWLALIVDPSTVWDAITSVLATIGGVIAALFGF